MKKIWLLTLSAALLAGCAVSDLSPVTANVRPGAVCERCGASWVMGKGFPGKSGMYSTHRKYRHSNCPFCTQMAARFMSGHHIEGTCPECGKTLRPCMFEVSGSQANQPS